MMLNLRNTSKWLENRLLIGLIITATILILGLLNQPYYPPVWIDEGFTLQGAINILKYGQYGMRSLEGMRLLDPPLIANGPGVVLPILASFALFGIGFLQARIVIVIYMVIAGLMFFGVTQKLFNTRAALIALFVLLAIPYEGFLLFGRNAIGMIPSFAYFLIGFYLWIVSVEKNHLGYSVAAGIFWGLAMATKGQYLLFLPTIAVVYLINFFFTKLPIQRMLLVTTGFIGLVLLVWYGFQFLYLGQEQFFLNVEAVRLNSKYSITAFRLSRTPGNIFYLVRAGMFFISASGWLYAVWLFFKKGVTHRAALLVIIVFIPIWYSWYAIVSAGFHRYSFDPYALSTIVFGAMSDQIIKSLRRRNKNPGFDIQWTVLLGSIILIFGFGIYSFIARIREITESPNRAAFVLAEYIHENVNPDSVIETWEWELDALTPDYTYHHPENKWIDLMTAKTQFGDVITKEYDPSPYDPDYLIDGPFSKWTGLYQDYLNDGCCELEKKVGLYSLYKVLP